MANTDGTPSRFVFVNLQTLEDASRPSLVRMVKSVAARFPNLTSQHANDLHPAKRRRRRKPRPTWSFTLDMPRGIDEESNRETDELSESIAPPLLPCVVNSWPPFACSKLWDLPCLPTITENYLTNLAVDIPELEEPGQSGILRHTWFAWASSSPELFNVIMLISASHYASQEHVTIPPEQLLHIKHIAIRSVNDALRNCTGPPPDTLIGAVVKFAAFEALYGTTSAYEMHMTGLQKMIKARPGGLEALGLEGLLCRIVLWIDANAAFLLNTNLHFQEATFSLGSPELQPNPAHFTGQS